MENSSSSILEKLRRIFGGWGLILVITLAIVVVFASFAKDTGASGLAQAASPTVDPMAGHNMSTPTPQVAAPTTVPATSQPVAGNDLDALATQMQSMMDSLNGMMQQLDQKGASVTPPTATPAVTTVDLQPLMSELKAINQEMGPLMVRIQADLQGNPTAEELASVRAQLQQIQTRMVSLMTKLQAARGGTAPAVVAAPTQDPMSGTNQQQPATTGQTDQSQAMMVKLNEMLQRMQGMLQTMQQNQQMQPGTMPGMPGMSSTSPQAQATPMPGMSTTDPAMSSPMMDDMDDMMMMMDDMMSMMDDMMGMGAMPMATPTVQPMPGMSSTDPAMSGMMMDDMMMMMDNMMMMMDNMMGGMGGGAMPMPTADPSMSGMPDM